MDGSSATAARAGDDANYLKAITACGDRRRLVVSQPIYSATGIKLLDSGARLDSRIFERLFGHTLAAPVESCVTSEDALTHRDIAERTRDLVGASPLLTHLGGKLDQRVARVWSALAAAPLPPSIALRLTVMRDTAPALYEHSLRAAFVALFVGVSLRYVDRDLQVLATAALLHDAGMQHVNPAHFEAGKPLDVAGRRGLFAHPLTAQMIVQGEPLLSPAIAEAIAQHHERLDGSGYPKGLTGDAIGKLARVLMVVELVLAMLEGEVAQPELQLSLILRLNHRSFDADVSTAVLAALPAVDVPAGATPCNRSAHDNLVALLNAWRNLRDRNPPRADDAAAVFIDDRTKRLQRWLAEAGLGSGSADAARQAAEAAPGVCAEVGALAREALWHLRQIAYDASEHWPQLAPRNGVEARGAAGQWIAAAFSLDVPRDHETA
ncbi:MAG TPA: HD domain-containing phosphohydrolase [Burkholderiaceae bacterium]|nr:HD domain-containing phosphohydrolase [Burkholderiaceae bacterium]